MPKTIKCPNPECPEEIPIRKVEDQIPWHDVIVYDASEYEVYCPYCGKAFYVEVEAEPKITVKP